MRALLLLLPLALTGCSYLWAAASPIRVEAETMVDDPSDPNGWLVEAKSSEKSHVSGRNNLALQGTVTDWSPDSVRVDAQLTSTEVQNTDPRNFYVYLVSGDQETRLGRVELGEVENNPYEYTYQYTARVEAGEVVFDDGSRAKVYENETRTAQAQENYYSRTATMWFEGGEVLPDDPAEVLLELRDVGVSMKLRWTLREGS